MMRLGKKKEEAKVDAKAESKSDTGMDVVNPEGETGKEIEDEGKDNGTGAVSVLGIGGKRIQGGAGKKPAKKRTPGEIRIQKDIADLDGGRVAQVDFPNANDLTQFTVTVSPDTGFWVGARYTFSFVIPPSYPHEPPKVTCRQKIYHPNINFEGAVCLNILREDWKPVLDINAVIYGLIYLFYDPNPDDPLNREAADLFRTDRAQFGRVVKRTLQGYSHAGESFEKFI